MKRPSFRALLRDLTPPVLQRVFRRTREDAGPRATCEGEYASYAAAAASAQNYEDDLLADVVLEKTLAYRALLRTGSLDATAPVTRVATTLGLLAGRGPELRVIDFGGAFGTHYWIARALVSPSVRLRWYVVETAAVCQRAAALATDELRFFSDLDEATRALGHADLVYCDGVLQAMPEPLALLDRLLGVPAAYLSVQRVGTADRRVITISRIPLSLHEPEVPLPADVADVVCALPMTYETSATYEAALAARTKIVLRSGLHDGPVARGPFTVHMRGYVCELATRS